MYFNGIRPSRQSSCPFLRSVILCFRPGICSSQSGVIFYVLIPSQSHFLPCAVTLNDHGSPVVPWSACTILTIYHRSPSDIPDPLCNRSISSIRLFSTRSQIFACLPACSCLFIAFVLRVYNLVFFFFFIARSIFRLRTAPLLAPPILILNPFCIIYATYQCSSPSVLHPDLRSRVLACCCYIVYIGAMPA